MDRSFQQDRQRLLSGQTRMEELAEGYLQAIRERNGEINAIVHVDEERVRRRAREIQMNVDRGHAGPLAGAVVAVKDVYAQKDHPLTCASGILKGFESVYDAAAVERLELADALIVARANMDEFAMGSSNEHSLYGACRNPLDPERVPGGSSGGSAAALAAGMCNTALGSDTGGSVRQPASYTGTVGLKPSYGRISRHGLVAYASSFDCVGPMGGSVQDVASLLQVLAGQDPMDHSSSPAPVEAYGATAVSPGGEPLRIGIPDEAFGSGLDPLIRDRILQLADDVAQSGHQLVPVSLPHSRFAVACYYILATAEASSNLARYDGIRYGARHGRKEGAEPGTGQTGPQELEDGLAAMYERTRSQGFGLEVKRRILLGTYVLSKGYYDAYYAKAQKVRRLIQQDFLKAFEQVDVILTPSTPTAAFRIGEMESDPLAMYLQDIYTLPANLAGICAISLPAGRDTEHMPFGLQLQAAPFAEPTLLRAAAEFEAAVSPATH